MDQVTIRGKVSFRYVTVLFFEVSVASFTQPEVEFGKPKGGWVDVTIRCHPDQKNHWEKVIADSPKPTFVDTLFSFLRV